MKNYKRTLLAASLVTLAPAVLGLALWHKLPERMAVHWDPRGVGYAGRLFGVLATPLLSLACLWLCVWLTARSKRAAGQNPRLLKAAVWCIPLVSLFASGLLYAAALDKLSGLSLLAVAPMALLMILLGNYLPKSEPNPVLGFRVKWTDDPQNWAATHRYGGRLWVGLGVAMLFCSLLPVEAATAGMLILLTVGCVLPVIYSYKYYKAHKQDGPAGTAEGADGPADSETAGDADGKKAPAPQKKKGRRWTVVLGVFLTVVLLVFLTGLLFGGDIELAYGTESFCVQADFWPDLTVRYDAVQAIELREESIPGARDWGLESLRLLAGSFSNEEFGSYTRYTYTGGSCFVVLHTERDIVVLGGQTEADTRAIYQELLTRCELG